MIINVNTEGLSNSVKPLINNVLSQLSSAKSAISSINLPAKFDDGGAIRKAASKLDSIQNGIEGISSWVDETISKFSNVETANNNLWQSLGTVGFGLEEGFPKREKSFSEKVKDNVGATAASVVNGAVAVVKGAGQFVEAVVDTGAIVATGVASIATGAYDGISYAYHAINGDTENYNSLTSEMWKGTMGFVAEEYVNNASDWFYNTEFGKGLDELAYKPFKSEGVACNIITGLGYTAGVVAATIATGRNSRDRNGRKCCDSSRNSRNGKSYPRILGRYARQLYGMV